MYFYLEADKKKIVILHETDFKEHDKIKITKSQRIEKIILKNFLHKKA